MTAAALLPLQTTGGRLLATAAVGGAMLVGLVGIRAAGRPLKRRFDAERVEAGQGLAWALVLVAGTGALVVLWQAVDDVRSAFGAADAGPRTGVLLLVSGVVFAVAYTGTRLTKDVIMEVSRGRDAISVHQREIAHHLVQIGIYTAAVVAVLSLWGIELGDLLIGAGALGVVLGLAARQTLGAVLAGFVVLFSRPFEIGDWVVVGEHEGVVRGVTIVNTQLRTLDDEVVLIPNDVITATEVVNRSHEGRLRETVEVGVDYETDVDGAAAIAADAVAGCDRVLAEPEPQVVGKRFGDSSVVLECRFWIDDPSASRLWRARTDAITAVHEAFADAGITIPFPQRTVGSRSDDTPTPSGGRGAERDDADGTAPRPPPDGRTTGGEGPEG